MPGNSSTNMRAEIPRLSGGNPPLRPRRSPPQSGCRGSLNDRTADAADSAEGCKQISGAIIGSRAIRKLTSVMPSQLLVVRRGRSTRPGSQHRMLIMPTRPRWATLRIESAELEPAFMVGDVRRFDPDEPSMRPRRCTAGWGSDSGRRTARRPRAGWRGDDRHGETSAGRRARGWCNG